MNILFSEGSSTSARQSISALGHFGYTIDLCDPQRLCLGRFSRYVRSWQSCPSFAREPGEYLGFLVERLQNQHYDVLLPTHDQVFLLSRYREDLGRMAGLAVPDFEAVRAVQSKVRFAELLLELKLPQPESRIVDSPDELRGQREYPCYVKREFSTAGRGVWRVENNEQMIKLAQRLAASPGYLAGQRIIVQQPAAGQYCVVQALFQHGRLVAAHCYTLRARGVGGSAHARESVAHPQAVEHASTLGAALAWHGALHMEYFFEPDINQPQYIEANPRIGETMNATLAGVNLCEMLVQISLGEMLPRSPPSRPGVRTHSLMMSLLAAAERSEGRRALLSEIFRAWQGEGVYAGSREELTPWDDDPLSVIPLAFVTARVLGNTAQAESIIRGAVEAYSLDEATIRRVLDLHADLVQAAAPGILDYGSMRL